MGTVEAWGSEGVNMERRETVSVKIEEIEDCIRKKIFTEFPYLKEDDIYEINLKSNVKFLLFEVVRMSDVAKSGMRDIKKEGDKGE